MKGKLPKFMQKKGAKPSGGQEAGAGAAKLAPFQKKKKATAPPPQFSGGGSMASAGY